MIQILLLTHAELAEGFQSAVNLIIGEQPCFEVLGLKFGQGLEEYTGIVHKTAESIASVDGTLIFADIFGGTPEILPENCFWKNGLMEDFRLDVSQELIFHC